jgi:hypothetical protein
LHLTVRGFPVACCRDCLHLSADLISCRMFAGQRVLAVSPFRAFMVYLVSKFHVGTSSAPEKKEMRITGGFGEERE